MKNCVSILYLAQLFLEGEMFQIKFVDKIKIHILCSVTFPENSVASDILWKKIWKSQRGHR
jgi:hypothetical protein